MWTSDSKFCYLEQKTVTRPFSPLCEGAAQYKTNQFVGQRSLLLLPCAQYVQKGYAIGHVCVCTCICDIAQNIGRLAFCRSKNVQKSTRGAFILHLGILNVTVNCRFTPGQALLTFVCSCLCVPRGHGSQMLGMSQGAVLLACYVSRHANIDVTCSTELQHSPLSVSVHRVCVLYNCS